jgi:HEAT repeat protein
MSKKPVNLLGLSQRMFQIRVGPMLVIVAGSALVIEAWKYWSDFSDSDRAMMSHHIRVLEGPRSGNRVEAAFALGQVVGPEMHRVVPPLLAALRDSEGAVRAQAAGALGAVIGENVERLNGDVALEVAATAAALMSVLGDKEPTVRARAIEALARIQVTNRQAKVSTAGATRPEYGPMGPDRRVLMPALHRALADPEAKVRRAACMAFDVFADAETDAPEELAAATTNDENLEVRLMAAYATVSGWRDRDPQYVKLVERLPQMKGEERTRLTYVLEVAAHLSGSPPAEAVPGLAAALEIDDPTIVGRVCGLIVRAGPAGRQALPSLLKRAQIELREDQELHAVKAILSLAPESPEYQSLIPLLVEQVKRTKLQTRAEVDGASWILRSSGPFARSAMPLLRQAFEAGDFESEALVRGLIAQLEMADDRRTAQPAAGGAAESPEPESSARER